MKPHDVLGVMRPHPVSVLLGTGYLEFASPLGVYGLAKRNGNGVNFLAVCAEHQGRGDFRRFVEACKETFAWLRIVEVCNKELAAALERYGFKAERWTDKGETVDAFYWSAP